MSDIENEISRISTNVKNSLDELSNLGVEVSPMATTDELAGYIAAIPTVTIPVAVSNGGTGANNASAARSNLGITPANIGAISSSSGSVSSTHIASNAVTTAKIADGNVTEAKLSSDIVAAINQRMGFKNILCVGDSWSEGVNSLDNGSGTTYAESLTWPNLLAGHLDCDFGAVREGGAGFIATGWRGNTFSSLVTSMAAASNYDAGVIVGGINDWSVIADESRQTEYAAAILDCCNAMYAKSNGQMKDIFWCMFWGPKGWGYQIPFTIGNAQIYLDANAQGFKVHCFPCWDAVMTRTDNWVVGTQFDPLHPNSQGYAAVAKTVARYMTGYQATYEMTDTQWAYPFSFTSYVDEHHAYREGTVWNVRMCVKSGTGSSGTATGKRLLTSRLNKFKAAYGICMTGKNGAGIVYTLDSQNWVDCFGEQTATDYGYSLIRLQTTVSDPSGTLTV